MDPDPLRHLEFFSVPNNQTLNPVDQSFGLGGPPTTQPPTTLWDAAMGLGPVLSGPSSAMSFDPMAQSSPSSAGLGSMPNPALARPASFGIPSRPTIPLRPPRSRDAHERKRSRIADTTPFDSVDYWIQFDNDESLADVSEGSDLLRHDTKPKAGPGPSTARSPSSCAKMESFWADRLKRRTSMAQGSTVSAPPAIHGAHRSRLEVPDNNSAEDNALSDEDAAADPAAINLSEHMSKIDSAPPADVPPREGLYSTPLSWERPQPGLRMDSLIGLNQAALNEAEQRRLIAIAMNSGPSLGGLGANVNLNFGGFNSGFNGVFGQGLGFGGNADPVSPPKPYAAQYRPIPPKRQGSVSEKGKEKEKEKDKDKPKAGDRTAHNDIERKYRTNLKDRISELRDAVPALHTIAEDGEDDDSTNRGAKVSKGAVLTKATEYIHYLERRNKQIMQEHRKLSQRLQAFEQLLASTARPTYQMPTYSRTLFDPRGFC
ncbi:hypothetical protein QBC39DRAFT_387651 [Podospora conica]|nr:hypothetical protein QBC39DRAFT_387651 [Schizothecium conicum]